MLVLSRKCNESIMLGEDIEIIITEVSGDKVKVGIKAPASTTILRKELFQTIADNREAAKTVGADSLKKMFGNIKP